MRWAISLMLGDRVSVLSWPRLARRGKVVCMRLERGVRPWQAALGGPLGTVAVVSTRAAKACAPGGRRGRGWAGSGRNGDRSRSADRRASARRRLRGGRSPRCLEHIRRVVHRVDADVVAWLHEVLEGTAVAEQELLMEGLDGDELRALRLLRRAHDYQLRPPVRARTVGTAVGESKPMRGMHLHMQSRIDRWSEQLAENPFKRA
jgi:hypothetical protein